MLFAGRAREAVERKIEGIHRSPELFRIFVAELFRSKTFFFSSLHVLQAVLVRASSQESGLAQQLVEALYCIRLYEFERMPDVRV